MNLRQTVTLTSLRSIGLGKGPQPLLDIFACYRIKIQLNQHSNSNAKKFLGHNRGQIFLISIDKY
jgi:hypothetical protein